MKQRKVCPVCNEEFFAQSAKVCLQCAKVMSQAGYSTALDEDIKKYAERGSKKK